MDQIRIRRDKCPSATLRIKERKSRAANCNPVTEPTSVGGGAKQRLSKSHEYTAGTSVVTGIVFIHNKQHQTWNLSALGCTILIDFDWGF